MLIDTLMLIKLMSPDAKPVYETEPFINPQYVLIISRLQFI